jgi:hypothetical protein
MKVIGGGHDKTRGDIDDDKGGAHINCLNFCDLAWLVAEDMKPFGSRSRETELNVFIVMGAAIYRHGSFEFGENVSLAIKRTELQLREVYAELWPVALDVYASHSLVRCCISCRMLGTPPRK